MVLEGDVLINGSPWASRWSGFKIVAQIFLSALFAKETVEKGTIIKVISHYDDNPSKNGKRKTDTFTCWIFHILQVASGVIFIFIRSMENCIKW